MTDTLVDIVNVTLDGGDLNDGSHTLVTTDASTAYVIKQVYVNGAALDSLPATVGGHSIGSFHQNLEGYEYIPVSSSLVLDSSDTWPLPAENILSFWTKESNDYPQSETLYSINGSVISVTGNAPAEEYAGTLASFTLNTGSISNLYKVGSAFYQTTADSNSVIALYYWSSGAASRTTVSSVSYNPVWVDPVAEEAYYFSGNSFYKHTPAGGAVVINATVSDTSWSTYSRWCYMKGWLFWIENNSGTTEICAISTVTGAHYKWYGLTTNASHSVGTRLVVSYDRAADKFYMYRTHASGDIIYLSVSNVTLTEMNAAADDSETTYNALTEETTFTGFSTSATRYDYTWGRCIAHGSPVYGDRFYYNGRPDGSPTSSTVKEIHSYNPDTQVESLVWTTSFDQEQDYGFGFHIYEPDLTEQDATSYISPPEFGIRIVGIKIES